MLHYHDPGSAHRPGAGRDPGSDCGHPKPIVTRRQIERVAGDSDRFVVEFDRHWEGASRGYHDRPARSEETPNVRPMVIVESSGLEIAAGGPVRLTDAHCLL